MPSVRILAFTTLVFLAIGLADTRPSTKDLNLLSDLIKLEGELWKRVEETQENEPTENQQENEGPEEEEQENTVQLLTGPDSSSDVPTADQPPHEEESTETGENIQQQDLGEHDDNGQSESSDLNAPSIVFPMTADESDDIQAKFESFETRVAEMLRKVETLLTSGEIKEGENVLKDVKFFVDSMTNNVYRFRDFLEENAKNVENILRKINEIYLDIQETAEKVTVQGAVNEPELQDSQQKDEQPEESDVDFLLGATTNEEPNKQNDQQDNNEETPQQESTDNADNKGPNSDDNVDEIQPVNDQETNKDGPDNEELQPEVEGQDNDGINQNDEETGVPISDIGTDNNKQESPNDNVDMEDTPTDVATQDDDEPEGTQVDDESESDHANNKEGEGTDEQQENDETGSIESQQLQEEGIFQDILDGLNPLQGEDSSKEEDKTETDDEEKRNHHDFTNRLSLEKIRRELDLLRLLRKLKSI